MPLTTPVTTNVLSYLQDTSKTLPMLAIEVPTTLGRTYQGYKRGGKAEAREKICEETLGAVVWLFGVKTLNKIGDFVGKNLLGLKDLDTDVGKDALRNPFENVVDKKGVTAAFKFSKIALSAILGTLAMGVVVPKIKQAMTNALRAKDGLPPIPDKNSKDGKHTPNWADKLVGLFIKPNKNDDKKTAALKFVPDIDNFVDSTKQKSSDISFKGGVDSVLYISHNLENNTAWRLLSTDAGTLAGRVVNSRSKKEGIEYFVRDSISSLFYIFAAPLFSAGVRNIADIPNVPPKGSEALCEHLISSLDTRDTILAKDLVSTLMPKEDLTGVLNGINFRENGTIWLEEFNRQTNGAYAQKAELMSKLQPMLNNENGVKSAILSKKQVQDVLSNSVTSDPVFLKKAISDSTGGRSDDIKAFVSKKDLEKIRDSFDGFVQGLEKYARKKGDNTVIDADLIRKYTKKLNRTNLLVHLTGMGFAILGLAVLIPKFQYYVSEKLTGEKDFPGSLKTDKQDPATV